MAWDTATRQQRGYGEDWLRAREKALKRDAGLCQPCLALGRITEATEVDHIVPKAKGGTHELTNLQSICEPCHLAKTAQDAGRKVRLKRTIGPDGWPL